MFCRVGYLLPLDDLQYKHFWTLWDLCTSICNVYFYLFISSSWSHKVCSSAYVSTSLQLLYQQLCSLVMKSRWHRNTTYRRQLFREMLAQKLILLSLPASLLLLFPPLFPTNQMIWCMHRALPPVFLCHPSPARLPHRLPSTVRGPGCDHAWVTED